MGRGRESRRKPWRNNRPGKFGAMRMSWIPFALLGAVALGYYGEGLTPDVSGFPVAKAAASNPESIVGRASVIDGDTIEIHGE